MFRSFDTRKGLAVLAMLLILTFVLAVAGALSGCGVTPTATFNDKVAIAEQGVQLVQTTATSLLRAQTITVEQDRIVQAQVKLVHESLVLAKSIQAGLPVKQADGTLKANPPDPAAAQKQLDAATAILADLKKQTGATSP